METDTNRLRDRAKDPRNAAHLSVRSTVDSAQGDSRG